MKDKLKSVRIEKGLTQQQLADLIGVKRQNVGRWETGEFEPSLKNLKRIAEALEIDIKELI